MWRGIVRNSFSFPTSLFRQTRDSFAKIYERCAKKCLKKVAFLAYLRYRPVRYNRAEKYAKAMKKLYYNQ